jgi:hypothetical protein
MVASRFPQQTMTAIRVFLFSCAMALSCQAESDPQSGRTIAMDEIRIAAQAEVLAARCGLRLNTELEQELRKDAAKRLTPEALLEMDEFARTYALSVMRRQRGGICTHAVDQFGPDGKQMQGLLLNR